MITEKRHKNNKNFENKIAELVIEKNWYKVLGQIEVLTPILAPYNSDYYSFRVFSKLDGEGQTVINNYDSLPKEEREELKKNLLKKGYVKVNYIFPRITPNEISWISYFTRPLYYLIKKKYNVSFRLLKIDNKDIVVRVLGFFIGAKKTGIYLEAVMEGSVFNIEGEVDSPIENIEFEAQIGKWKKLGFGRVKIRLYRDSNRKNK